MGANPPESFDTITSEDGKFAITNLPCTTVVVMPQVMLPRGGFAVTSRNLITKVNTRKQSHVEIDFPEGTQPFRLANLKPAAATLADIARPPATGTWRWDLEPEMRRDVIVRVLGDVEAARYEKLPSQAQIRMFLETFWKSIARDAGIQTRDPRKEMANAGLQFFLLQIPRPIFADYAVSAYMAWRTVRDKANTDEEKIARDGLRDALAIIKALAPPDASEVEQRFREADPTEKAGMFLEALKLLLSNRIWPSAYLLYHAYASPDIGIEFVGSLDPAAAEGWEQKDLRQRTEIEWQTVQILMLKLERLLKDDTGAALMPELSRALNLGPQGLAGRDAIRRVFGKEVAERATDAAIQERWGRAAAAFHTAWLIALAVSY
jgi:hypothetical protein